MEQAAISDNRREPAFDVPLEQIVQSSRGKDWGGLDIAEIVHPLDDFAAPALPRHVLVINLGPPAEVREQRVGRQGHLSTGGIVILPAGAARTWHLERQGEVRHLHLYLPPALITRVATEADINADGVELIEAIGADDPQIEGIALSLLSELQSNEAGGKLYAQSLANLLVIQLLRRHTTSKLPVFSQKDRGLSTTALRKVLGYIDEHMADDLSLPELAAVTNLSMYHFARLFKCSLGLSPHQYIIQRRVERAKLLLATTKWPIARIAQAVGFVSESHLALHFKRLTGLTPAHFRQ